MKSHSKNKYAKNTGRPKRLKEFMHKVEVWLPTKTYNMLKDRAITQGQDESLMASLGLYRALNVNSTLLVDFYVPFVVSTQAADKTIVDILSKYILATMKSGISTQDLVMLGIDAGLTMDSIAFGLSYLINEGLIERNDDGKIRFDYNKPLNKTTTLATFKGVKIVTVDKKQKQQRESLINKRSRTWQPKK